MKNAKMNISSAADEALAGKASHREPIGEGADWMYARAGALPNADWMVTARSRASGQYAEAPAGKLELRFQLSAMMQSRKERKI